MGTQYGMADGQTPAVPDGFSLTHTHMHLGQFGRDTEGLTDFDLGVDPNW